MAEAHGVFALRGDGNQLDEVVNLTEAAVRHIRKGQGPALLELTTYRFREHCGPDLDPYQPPEEVAEWKIRDPIRALPEWALAAKEEIAQEIEEAFHFAESSQWPSVEQGLEKERECYA